MILEQTDSCGMYGDHAAVVRRAVQVREGGRCGAGARRCRSGSRRRSSSRVMQLRLRFPSPALVHGQVQCAPADCEQQQVRARNARSHQPPGQVRVDLLPARYRWESHSVIQGS